MNYVTHEYPGAATHTRSAEGSLVDGAAVNRGLLTEFLAKHAGMPLEDVEVLLDPADHQNVPKTVELLRAIIELKTHNAPQSPAQQATHRAIRLFSKLWGLLLSAFLERKFSLSQQLEHLSAFAHLLFALFRLNHASKFMSGQLYIDLQAMVKAAFTCVGQQQLLDDSQPFHLHQLGSDRLEGAFSEVRTQSHDRNCDVVQLAQRLSAAADDALIYERYPDWYRGPRRLSWTGRGDDHVNPAYYIGDLVVRNIDLAATWNGGMMRAMEILDIENIRFDFDMALSAPGVDLMRPRGNGKYPGVSSDLGADRSLPSEDQSSPATMEDANTSSDFVLVESSPEELDILASTEEAPVGESESVSDLRDRIVQELDDDGNESILVHSPPALIDVPVGEDGTKTKQVYKAALLRRLFVPGAGKIPLDRVLWVRFRQKPKPMALGTNLEKGETCEMLHLQDHVLAPVRAGDTVAIAVLHVSAIERQGTRVLNIPLDEMRDPAAKIMVIGQVLQMRELAEADEVARSADAGADSAMGRAMAKSLQPRSWFWTGGYGRFLPSNVTKQGESAWKELSTAYADRMACILSVPGHFGITPVSISLLSLDTLSSIDQNIARARGLHETYSFTHQSLQDAIMKIFEPLDPSVLSSTLPRHGLSDSFPYRNEHGEQIFYYYTLGGMIDYDVGQYFTLERASAALKEKRAAAENLHCHQCGERIPGSMACAHVGGHLLLKLLCVEEQLKETVSQLSGVFS